MHFNRFASPCPAGRSRRLRLERLEERRVLATMVVTDLDDGPLETLAGDGELSLREAVEAINSAAAVDGIGPSEGNFGTNDTILFESALFSSGAQTLLLTAGQLELVNPVILVGPATSLLKIDAQQNSRVFLVPELSTGDYLLARMTLTGGRTTGTQQLGGAVHSFSTGTLSLSELVITNSSTLGNFAAGGGVSALGDLAIVSSSILNNHTAGLGANGGGVFAQGNVTLTRSWVQGNSTQGTFSGGGGISANGIVSINSSTVASNETTGSASSGGGILAVGNVLLTESTVSGNRTLGTTSSGAGVSSSGLISVTRSTIVGNQAEGGSATGGGLQTSTSHLFVTGSIVANNLAGGGGNDISHGSGFLTVTYSLIEDATGLGIPAATNLLGIDPELGPLSNSPLTPTHAPLPGSPVIDAGDPAIASPPQFDQRGFPRIANGDLSGDAVIDMGSHEVKQRATANFVPDNRVNGADFLAWQRGYGNKINATVATGNSDEDNDTDNQDLAVWQAEYGRFIGRLAAVESSAPDEVASQAQLVDLAMAIALAEPTAAGEGLMVDEEVAEQVSDGEFSVGDFYFVALEAFRSEQTSPAVEDTTSPIDAALEETLIDASL